MSEPLGERVARVETKIDMVLARLDGFEERFVPRTEVEEKATARRWLIGTFAPLVVAVLALTVSTLAAFGGHPAL